MILSELKQYLQLNQRALLTDLSNRFDTEPDALRAMLERWIQKGKVKKMVSNDTCRSSCGKCSESAIEIYEWVDKD